MKTFTPGTHVEVKDFNRMDPTFSTGPLKVSRRTDDFVYLIADYGEELKLPVHRALNYEWLFFSPFFMLSPAGSGAFERCVQSRLKTQ